MRGWETRSVRPRVGELLYNLAAGAVGLTREAGGAGAVRPVPGSRIPGISDSRVRVLGARRCRAAGFSRKTAPRSRQRRSRSRDPAARFPKPENPRIRHPAAPGGQADATVLFCCVCQEGSAPRSVSSPGLLGKPCLKTRKETRSNGAHPCFVPFKLECSKDSGERRLAVCCFFRRVGPGLRPSRRDIGKHTRFRLSPQADSEVEPLLNLPPPPAFLRAEFATAMLRPALKRLNPTQRAQSHAPPGAQRLNHTQRAQSLAPPGVQAFESHAESAEPCAARRSNEESHAENAERAEPCSALRSSEESHVENAERADPCSGTAFVRF